MRLRESYVRKLLEVSSAARELRRREDEFQVRYCQSDASLRRMERAADKLDVALDELAKVGRRMPKEAAS